MDNWTSYDLTDKRVLVTGAAGQLGSVIVHAICASEGYVLATDASIDDLVAAQHQWGWPEDRVKLASVDIRQQSDIQDAIAFASNSFGGVDLLINNAGVSVFEPYLDRSEDSIDWVMNVNLKGTILCTHEFAKHRIAQGGGGAIVNVGSHYGLISPDPRIYTDCARKNSEIYGATKAGIIQMTRYYAVHLAEHGIRVNAVSPGGILNSNIPQGPDFQANYGYRCPMGRMAETHEIVRPILFLLSSSASYINGHNMIVDGGMTSW